MAAMDVDAWFERRLERIREARKIRCPYCKQEIDYTSEDVGLVTYWGEDGPVEISCEHCDEDFFVREHVERTFTVGKSREEANE
jgi:DNA-directed RNA polymerase subunit RPC12/RpoP